MAINTSGNQRKRTLILGTNAFSRTLAAEILGHPRCGSELVGMVSNGSDEREHQLSGFGVPVLGTLDQLHEIILEHKPEQIIVTLPDLDASLVCHSLIEEKYCRHISIADGEALYERLTGKIAIDTSSHNALLFSNCYQVSRYSQNLSHALSIAAALVGLIVFAPLMLLVSILIKLDSPGPVLFVQKRMGMNNKEFNLLKFRTMLTQRCTSSEWAHDNKSRITRVGRYLRKFRLDELPQFINVLQSHMNLVGPRPHPAKNYSLYALVSRNMPVCGDQIPYYSLRALVRPGITGWAQVRYRYANNLEEEIEKLRFDLYYVKHYSFWLDLRIIAETVKVVVMGQEYRVEQAPNPGKRNVLAADASSIHLS